MKYKLGLDVGGTKIEAVLLNENSEVSQRQRVPTEREKGANSILAKMQLLITKVLDSEKIDLRSVKGIGIGLPGSVDPDSKLMINGNTTCLVDVPVAKILSEELDYDDKRIFVANDANCFALAEAKLGVGKGYHKNTTSIGIIIGTGCGGGIVINGQLFEGTRGGAAEIGHTCLEPNGLKCYCGRRGCAELYLSGKGIENIYKENTGKEKYATEILKEESYRLQYKKYLSQFLLNLINTFDPSFIVFGGGISKDTGLWEEIKQELITNQFLKGKPLPALFQNSLGDSAGVFGAALLIN